MEGEGGVEEVGVVEGEGDVVGAEVGEEVSRVPVAGVEEGGEGEGGEGRG